MKKRTKLLLLFFQGILFISIIILGFKISSALTYSESAMIPAPSDTINNKRKKNTMTSAFSKVHNLDFDSDNKPIVTLNGIAIYDSTLLIKELPELKDPKWAAAYAQMVNHIERGDGDALILEPEKFRIKYMNTYNAEDPNEEVRPGQIRLRNFGIPDFSTIQKPINTGDTLIFFVENMFMNYPYKVTMEKGKNPEYTPVRVTE